MRLSEAIRLGSMASEKCIGMREASDGSRCAIGAALFAIGKSRDGYWLRALFEQWPWLRDTRLQIPGSEDKQRFVVYECIWRLNDQHEWSRERIADWVATVEPPETAPETEPCVSQVTA